MDGWTCEKCREPNAMCATACVDCGSPVPVPTVIEAGALRIQVAQLRKERDEARAELARAVKLLHMLDRADARHPDVAAFLDGLDHDIDARRFVAQPSDMDEARAALDAKEG